MKCLALKRCSSDYYQFEELIACAPLGPDGKAALIERYNTGYEPGYDYDRMHPERKELYRLIRSELYLGDPPRNGEDNITGCVIEEVDFLGAN